MNIPVEFSFLGGWYIHVYIHTSTISNYCKLLVNDSIFPLKAMVCHASGFLNTFRVRSSIRLDEHAWSIQPQSIAVDAQKNSGKNIKLLNIHMQRIDFPGESQAHIACRSLFFLVYVEVSETMSCLILLASTALSEGGTSSNLLRQKNYDNKNMPVVELFVLIYYAHAYIF